MTTETKSILKKLIEQYMKDNNISFVDLCPFPVSWRTISAIKDSTDRTFNTATQAKLCKFFNLDFEKDGRDVKILCKQK